MKNTFIVCTRPEIAWINSERARATHMCVVYNHADNHRGLRHQIPCEPPEVDAWN